MSPGSSGAKQAGETPTRHERAYRIFTQAIELATEDRANFLDQACAGDEALRGEIGRLLEADARTATMLEAPPRREPFAPGKELGGRFRVIRIIASGGMGDVYEAEDLQLGERVALKTIRAEVVNQPQALARFKREIQYAKRVTHPNVCRIHDLGSHREGDAEIVFLTMELLAGETLSAHLRSAGRMSCAEALPLVTQMAEALAAAHSNGIIHRDFKPSNVMLIGAGASRHAVVTDFGLAQSATGSGDETSLTESGKMMGTPAYMAPEQLTAGVLTPATDIYALGLVIYEMITGRRPFEGKTPLSAAMKRLSEAPPPPSQYAPEIDSRWTAAIMRCLERDPARRFQSAIELIEALNAPPRSPTLERLEAIAKKKSTRASAALLAMAAIVVAALWIAWIVGRHRPSAAAERWYDEGTRALRDGTSFTAMNALERASELDPSFSLAHARLAEAATELDYNDKAKSEMLLVSPALESFFLSSREKLRLRAVYFVLLKDFARAAAAYRELAAKAPSEERAAVLVDLGRAYEGGGKFPEALSSYTESIALDNQFAAAFLRRAALEGRQRLNANAAADFDAAEKLYRLEGNAEGITEVTYQRALLFRRTGKLADARAPAEKALEMAVTNRDEYHQIKALLMLSYLLYNAGDVDGGEKQARDAIGLAQRAGIESLAASGLVDIGSALFIKGDNAAAEPALRNALEIASRFQSVQVEARAEMVLGQVLVNLGRMDEAFPFSQHAIEHFEQAGDKSSAARASIPAARIRRDRGDYEGSARLFREGLQLAESAKDPGVVRLAAQGLAAVLLLEEKYPEALKSASQSAETAHAVGDLTTEAYSELSRANALWPLGRYTEASEAQNSAEKLDQKLNGLKPLLASLYFSRTEMDLSRLNLADLQRDLRRLSDAAGNGPLAASAKRFLAMDTLARGRSREALTLSTECVALAQSIGDVSLLKNSKMVLAEAKLASGDQSGALALASELARDFGEKEQYESQFKALTIAISATGGAEHNSYITTARAVLTKLRQNFGQDFRGFISRPDIRQEIVRAGLTSEVQ